jgi:hypothetical protein
VARIDKYVPEVSGTRAVLHVALAEGDLEKVIGVGLNANGRAVKGPGNTGIIGLLVNSRKSNKAGDVVDVMSLGDIVGTTTEFPAGTVFGVVDSTGVVAAIAGANPVIPAGSSYVGHTVEAGRLVVRFDRKAGA